MYRPLGAPPLWKPSGQQHHLHTSWAGSTMPCPPGYYLYTPPPGSGQVQMCFPYSQQGYKTTHGMGEISTVDISHFRAPYKNAYPYTGIGTIDLPMVLGFGFVAVASLALLVHIGRK